MKAIVTVGVSGSGKTTWAKQFVKDNETDLNQWSIVERDSIRDSVSRRMLGHPLSWRSWDMKLEPKVTLHQRISLEMAAKNGMNVIVSDTNLKKARRDELANFLEKLGFQVELMFFDVKLRDAIVRDRLRGELSVGEGVIRMQYKQWMDQFQR